jgi:hypothetical protein
MFVSCNQMNIRIMKNDPHLIVLMKESQNDSAVSGNHFDFRFYPTRTLFLFIFVNDFVISVDHVVFPRSGICAFSARSSLLRLLRGLLIKLYR